jgi:dTDP-4-amino-4,6-dideoxygalactose transaminase
VLGIGADTLPVATAEWQRMISLPLFPSMTTRDVDRVAETLRAIVRRHRR